MLKINNRFRIVSADQWSYALQELRDVKNPRTKEVAQNWKHVGWYGKVSHALNAALNRYINELIGKDDYDCKALIDKIAEAEKDFEKIDLVYPSKLKAPLQKAGDRKEKQEQEEDDDVL